MGTMTKRKRGLRDFERNVVLVPGGLVWVFQTLLIYWDFHSQPSPEFTENILKKEKSWQQSCGWKVRGEMVDWFEIMEKQQ